MAIDRRSREEVSKQLRNDRFKDREINGVKHHQGIGKSKRRVSWN